MPNKLRKVLIGFSLFASCGLALTQSPTTAAETTFPRITVIGHRPQSAADIERALAQVRGPGPIQIHSEYNGLDEGGGGSAEIQPSDPQMDVRLPNVNCRASQDARTESLSQALSIPASWNYMAFGTEITVRYMNSGSSETFRVTGGGGGYNPTDINANLRAITPVAGSLVCP